MDHGGGGPRFLIPLSSAFSFGPRRLSEESTPSPGFRAYAAVVGIACGAALLVALAVLLIVLLLRARRRRKAGERSPASVIPASSKEIKGIMARQMSFDVESAGCCSSSSAGGKGKGSAEEDCGSGRAAAGKEGAVAGFGMGDIGWGRWYTAAELEAATDGFSAGNVIGEGGYGTVYRGLLPDSSVVAVKNLLNNRGQAEKEFQVEVEAIGKVRHKNLVGLLGYCAEGPRRMLVFEYMDNGNLEQWLHGNVGPVSPLNWDVRIKIAIDTAKGIAYLHEGLEPKVVHRDIKSSNILLDKHWNARVSDFGLAKLLGSESSYVTTRVMGTFGYVAPEYASTGMLNEASDVYSFGVLLIELVTGRSPVDYSRGAGEASLVDWFKGMVGSRRGEDIVDPLLRDQPPPSRALKRLLLICLRCVDSVALARPKMGQVVHMLEGDDFPFRARITRPAAYRASSILTRNRSQER